MATTAWLFASYPSFPEQSIDVIDDVAASEAKTFASADVYLHHSSLSLDAKELFQNVVNSHSNISDCNIGMTKSGKVRAWRTGGSNFGITWTNTALRDFFGFTGNLTGANTYTATNYSRWFWSPGKPESTKLSPLGIVGARKTDAVKGMAGDATFRVTKHNEYRIQEYWWRYVALSRVWTSSEAGGEFHEFAKEVLGKGRQWFIWRNVAEDLTDDTTIATLSTPLGPYKSTKIDWSDFFRREIRNVDSRSPIEIPCIQVAEYS